MMTEWLAKHLNDLESKDDAVRKTALDDLLAQTADPVDWFDDAFTMLVDKLNAKKSFQRSIGVMLLSNLAKSDLSGRLSGVIGKCMELMEDEKFITSRMAAQSVWKIGIAQPDLRPEIVDGMMNVLKRSSMSSHPNLIRQDIVAGLVRIHEDAPSSADIGQITAYLMDNCEAAERKRLLSFLP